jgi:hypothetical protein
MLFDLNIDQDKKKEFYEDSIDKNILAFFDKDRSLSTY